MKTNKTLIIAEAGVNHNGNLKLAKKLINLASLAGADIVKFQTFKAEKIVSMSAPKANYQKITTSKHETQYDMLKKYELSFDDHLILKQYCNKKKIEFLSTPFDINSVNLLKKISLKRIKISSGDITNLPFLRSIARLNIPTIMSTGMSNLKEVGESLSVLIDNGLAKSKITLLHCTTSYPTKFHEVNLNAMVALKNKFNIDVGYSDHTIGIEVPIAAVAMGAKVIEKHFTLDKKMRGPDHLTSIEYSDLKKMVSSIRNIEKSLGSYKKIITNSEKKNLKIVRKSIHAFKSIKKGEVFNDSNITIKRPAIGISPMKWDKIIGTKSKKNFNKDKPIK
tara:strand:- start:16245 stop:17252 length:1008 start_codon:yes stop_codon:yes gene_type:complete